MFFNIFIYCIIGIIIIAQLLSLTENMYYFNVLWVIPSRTQLYTIYGKVFCLTVKHNIIYTTFLCLMDENRHTQME